MALADARQTSTIVRGKGTAPQKGSTTIYAGALVALDASGYLAPGTTTTGLIAVGKAKTNSGLASWVNAGSDGASNADYEEGIHGWDNSAGGDEITNAHKGKPCYIVDDETVALTSNSGARSPAGRVKKVEGGQVYVEMSEMISRQIAEETAQAPGSAYTQTYSTANRTVAAPTAATLTVADGAGTNDGTIGAITADASVIAAVQELAAQINKLVADDLDNRQTISALIDDLQAAGIVS